MRDTRDDPRALPPLTGNLWVPVWAIRPGSYEALATLADAMPLWLALHSRCGDYWRPCYATREQLGVTIGAGRAKVTRLLAKLRKAGLLFEVDRGMDPKNHRRRAIARWALDPHAADLWRERVESALATVAEEDGQDGRWYRNAVTSLDAFERRCRLTGARIAADMPIAPKQRKRRKSKRKRTPKEPGSKTDPGVQDGPRGEGFYQGGGAKGSCAVHGGHGRASRPAHPSEEAA